MISGYDTLRTAPRVGRPGTAGDFALAAIDIDDTLIGPDAEISASNAEAIDALRRGGVQVVLASGRSHANMLRFHQALGLPADGPVVSAQGAVVRTADGGAAWHERPIAPAQVQAITRAGLERGLSVQHYRRDGIFIQERTRWTAYDQSRNDEPQQLVADLLADGGEGVSKIIWLGTASEIARLALEQTAAWHGVLTVTHTDAEYLEFTDATANKATGLAAVAERLGIARERVIAFGDGNNDVPMLAWAGLGVAMFHGRPAAREAATFVAPAGNPETALARAVRAVLAA